MQSTYEDIHTSISQSLPYKSVPRRYINQLFSLFDQDSSSYFKAIQNIFLQLCVLFHKDQNSLRGLKVIYASLADIRQKKPEDSAEMLRLFSNVLKLLLMGCEAREKTQRHASSWLLDKVLSLNLQALSIPSHLFDKTTRVCKELLKDKHAGIRFHAVNIAKKCEMTVELLKAMNYEPDKDIRKHIIGEISIDKRVCKGISKRLKDNEPSVRLAACRKLKDLQDFSHCKDILLMAVMDRDKEVREAALTILTEYIKSNGLLSLSSLLQITHIDSKKQREVLKGFRYVCENIATIEQLVDVITGNIYKITEINAEELLILRMSVESLKGKNENLLYSLMPELSKLGLKFLHNEYPLIYTQNVLRISMCLDLGEEFTRTALMGILREMCGEYPLKARVIKETMEIQEKYCKLGLEDYFPTCAQDVIAQLVSCIRHLLKDQETEFCRILIEDVNTVREPIMPNIDMGETSLFEKRDYLENRLQSLEDEEKALTNEIGLIGECNTSQENLSRKLQLEEEINKADQDLENTNNHILEVLHRSLMLTCEMLRLTKHGVMDAEVTEIIQTLIYPSLKFKERHINVLAIECLGLFCLNHPQACKEYLYIFKVILQKHAVGVLEFTALKAVLDFFMVFEFEETRKTELDLLGGNVLEIVSKYTECANLAMRSVAVEGICKLLLLERSRRPDLLAKLLLCFFDSESPDPVKQVLHVFFTHFPLVSETNSKSLADGFLLALSLISANINKIYTGLNLSTINVNKIFSFVFLYLNPAYLQKHAKFSSNSNFHFYMFFTLAQLALQYPDLAQGKIYPRMLIQLNFLSFSHIEMSLAYKLLKGLSKCIKDRTCINAVNKVVESLGKNCEKVEKKHEGLENDMIEIFRDGVRRTEEFLRGYKRIAFDGKSGVCEDPVEGFNEEVGEKRGSECEEGMEKRIKLGE